MSSSREESPDWLRSFQAPSHSVLPVSSDSQSSLKDSPSREDIVDIEEPSPSKSPKITKKGKNQAITLGESGAGSASNKPSKAKSPKKRLRVEDQTPQQKKNTANKKRKTGEESDRTVAKEVTLEKHIEPHESNDSVWMLSSDSESGRDNSPVMEDNIHHAESSDQKTSEFRGGAKGDDAVLIGSDIESPSKKASKEKSSRKRLKVENTPVKEEKINESMEIKGNVDNVEVAEEETSDKHIERHASSSRLPLMLSEKVHRSKALVECEGDSIDLSGDMGAVGRIVISDAPSGNHEMYLDLKGTIYKTTIVPSRTFCIVSFGQSEAKVCQLFA
ncbi:hypothetical protein FH972_016128 [Carpinus fangiana]|uniref:DNA-binding protein BIN4 n=1 Tax=Carpinus fangiana TaxID=176857 RepID=A0A5N6RG14_9ROSI|nr:hypothetical protein FH972_016128 [Carpinus fangiana]